jgi:ribosomal protein S3
VESEMNLVELVQEMEKRFPKELTICVQAVQIKQLNAQLHTEGDNPESEDDDAE